MQTGTNTVARSPRLRSGLTNRPFRLPNVDMRTSRGRRFRDIIDGLIAEFGAANADRLRDLATQKLVLEDIQGAVVSGDQGARDDLVRQANLVARQETALREARPRHVATPDLATYLAQNHGEVAA